MIAVTIGIGDKFVALAELAASTVRRHTGLRTYIIGEEEVRRFSLSAPHHLKFHLFDIFRDDAIMYFDADTMYVRRFEAGVFESDRRFVCVRDMNHASWIADDAWKIGVRQEDYFNSGFFIVNREHHSEMLRHGKKLVESVKTNFKDQSQLNLARSQLGIPTLYLPETHNRIRGDCANDHSKTVMIHFDNIDRRPKDEMIQYYQNWQEKLEDVKWKRGVNMPEVTIASASYGPDGDAARTIDAKPLIDDQLRQGNLVFPVNDLAKPHDPAYRVVKTVRVSGTVNGKPFEWSRTDGDLVNFLSAIRVASPAGRIYTFVAYSPSAECPDLGEVYNSMMDLLPSDDDWACFLDHDAMFTTKDWYRQLMEIVALYPDAGCFTAKTNRVGNWKQVVEDSPEVLALSGATRHRKHLELLDRNHGNHDIRFHREVGRRLAETRRLEVTEMPRTEMLLSGVIMLVQKRVWQKVPFRSGFFGVDHALHWGCLTNGLKVYLMEGVYVYHWYRGDGDRSHVNSKAFRAIRVDGTFHPK